MSNDLLQKESFVTAPEEEGQRLDKVLQVRFADKSRSFLQLLIKDGFVLVSGKPARASQQLGPRQKVTITFPEAKSLNLKPKNMDLDIVFEDKDLLVINKPSGLVVHPGVGDTHSEDSLVNAILHHCGKDLSGIGGVKRPGIVHRLDKDTSGLIVVAKNDNAHRSLTEQFRNREVKKKYVALLIGHLEPVKGTIEAPIGRDPANRKKMAVVRESEGKMAVTKYSVLEYLKDFTLVDISLLTGRTHQIRVHFASIGFPLVGDPMYGREKMNKYFDKEYGLKRVFLHAVQLSFTHPRTKKKEEFECALPFDLDSVVTEMKAGK